MFTFIYWYFIFAAIYILSTLLLISRESDNSKLYVRPESKGAKTPGK